MNNNGRYRLLFNTLEVIAIFLGLGLVNINSLVRFRQFPEVDNYSDNERGYIFAAILVIVLILFLLYQNQLLEKFTIAWRSNTSVMIFLLWALVSMFWTVYPAATSYKLFFLYFSAIVGSYIAIRYKLRGVVNVLTWLGGVCAVLSILVVAYFPLVGVMQNPLFLGSWTGIFWHRNHTGNIFAFFNMVFLLRLLFDNKLAIPGKSIIAILYLLSALIVFSSRSATGIIVFLCLHCVVGLTTLWLNFRDYLKPWHYYLSASMLLSMFLIFITNTAFFFGLLGRSPDMTGRVPVWLDLFQSVYLQNPIVGYGYGALWMQKRFRIMMQIRHHWGNQLYFSDNGFFDILLNLGLIGLLLFLAVYIPAGIRSFTQAIATKSWLSFFPFLTFLYILIGNLTYSFLLEVDQFVWMLLVIMVFLTTPPSNAINPQP